MENESNSQPPRLSIFSSIPILIIIVYNYRCSVLLAHASKINLWTLSLFSNSPMDLMMEFMYAHLVDSASAQEHQVSCHGHITTYLIYCIELHEKIIVCLEFIFSESASCISRARELALLF
ncbi:hypothetical protein PVAP13_9KG052500 [Panicum virgatum]|uniref:Uncharacterized protein n=1 Tax=Panicum virgatum TaxID=38727 RepID=A0A8T0ND97_PANVG|nr:hypothetical protein PVAP13_9KG052500 [Panicum virgatum]